MHVKKLTSLIIEPTNVCNLNCSICPTNSGMTRKKGFLSFNLFQNIIAKSTSLEHLCFHNWGEPLLNSDLFEMIKYAHNRGIRYTVLNTNGTLLDDNCVNQIIDSPLSIIRISVDGNPYTYQQIRRISFKTIEKNIFHLIKKRDKTNGSFKVGIVMVIDEQTENQIDSFYNKWRNIVDHIRFQPKIIQSKRKSLCPELFGNGYGQMVVLWDGKVIPCCVDYEGKLQIGDAQHESVDSIWHGLEVKRLRKKHLRGDFPDICKNCNEYESKNAVKRFVVN